MEQRVLVSVLCSNSTSRFRCNMASVSKQWNSIATATSCVKNSSFNQYFGATAQPCRVCNGERRQLLRANPRYHYYKDKRDYLKDRNQWYGHSDSCQCSFNIYRGGITICYHLLIRLKSRKLTRPAFMWNCRDADAVAFVEKYRKYTFRDPICIDIYYGKRYLNYDRIIRNCPRRMRHDNPGWNWIRVAAARGNTEALGILIDGLVGVYTCIHADVFKDITTDALAWLNDQYVIAAKPMHRHVCQIDNHWYSATCSYLYFMLRIKK